MKHISAHFDKVEEAVERFAFFPVRSTFSEKLIWFKKYVELRIYYDSGGKPPINKDCWNLIYTKAEYTYYCLRKSSTDCVN